ncbi:hypothetical protein [Streptomyces sp. NPDC001642]|uniref:hypothetical protein n=1 Tax=Streptomyces sp. NPDC001642 TaxID=3154392 RepID=UPI003318BEA6
MRRIDSCRSVTRLTARSARRSTTSARGDVVDQPARVVGQGAQLGDGGSVTGVVHLGHGVEHIEGDGLAHLVDNGL